MNWLHCDAFNFQFRLHALLIDHHPNTKNHIFSQNFHEKQSSNAHNSAHSCIQLSLSASINAVFGLNDKWPTSSIIKSSSGIVFEFPTHYFWSDKSASRTETFDNRNTIVPTYKKIKKNKPIGDLLFRHTRSTYVYVRMVFTKLLVNSYHSLGH